MVPLFYKEFKKKSSKLPVKIQGHFYERLELFLKDPTNRTLSNHSVEKTFPNGRSINITGDYRAIYKEEGDTVIFITIGTHSELYK